MFQLQVTKLPREHKREAVMQRVLEIMKEYSGRRPKSANTFGALAAK